MLCSSSFAQRFSPQVHLYYYDDPNIQQCLLPETHDCTRFRRLLSSEYAHVRQPRPDSGLGFQVEVLQTFQAVTFPLGSGIWTVIQWNSVPVAQF